MPPPRRHRCARALRVLLAALPLAAAPAQAQDVPEYRLKAAFLYNFAAFTEWPAETGNPLNLCVFGADPFGSEIELLQGKKVGARSVAVHRKAQPEALKGCHVVFVAHAAIAQLPRVLDALHGQPALVVTENAGAAPQGAALNLSLTQGRVTFDANLAAARAARLNLSSRLLRLATEVVQ